MKALLVGPMLESGTAERRLARKLAREAMLIVAVDGGLDRCADLGLRPHVAIGDWDSLNSRRRPTQIPSLSLPKRKDRSDFYWAVELAHEFGGRELRAIGFDGGRRDHEFAVWLEAAVAMRRHADLAPFELHSTTHRVFFVSDRQHRGLRLALPPGTTFSVFSLLGTARGVLLRGSEYRLRKALLETSSRGLSNRSQAPSISLTLKRGALALVVHPSQKKGPSRRRERPFPKV